MLKIKNYIKAESLEQAYELNQKRTACVLGGMVWLKMGNRNIMTAIDLSGLGLDTITETEEAFVIGCMTPLHALETHKELNAYTNSAIRESVRHIVGVQFRNCATVGGSIFGRFGFSDVLTMFLALDTWVELYNGGTIPLAQFASMEKDNDILVNIIVKKQPLNSVYLSQRNNSTDFPVLTCAAALIDGKARTVIGARPGKAMIVEDEEEILKDFVQMNAQQKKDAAASFAACSYRQEHACFKRIQKSSCESTYKKSLGRDRRESRMNITFWLNGVKRQAEVRPDELLLDFLRKNSCYSVKRGCETANCGLCTVLMDERPVLSCSMLAARADGKRIVTLEGMQEEAKEFGAFMANEGAEQCGFCNPGFIMNVFAMLKELEDPTEEDILEYLSGNLCRCSGFVGQTRSILKFLDYKKGQEEGK